MKGPKVVWLVATSVLLLMSLVASPVTAEEGGDAGAAANPPTKAPGTGSEVPGGSGKIACFKCKSDTDKGCTLKTPSGSATPQESCPSPNALAKEWILSHKLDQFGAGSINLENVFNVAESEAKNQTGAKERTGCALFFSSSENVLTKAIDPWLQILQKYGNTGVNTTALEYVQRDCVTMPGDFVDGCVPYFDKVDKLLKIFLCICSTDKCNEGVGSPKIKGLIADAAAKESSAWGNQHHDKSLIWIMVTMLSTYLVL